MLRYGERDIISMLSLYPSVDNTLVLCQNG